MVDLENSQKAQKAMQLFKSGYNCAQAVAGAWCEEIGLDFETAVRISAAFGGGMGRMREVCGTCSGAFMVLSMKYGGYSADDNKSKKELYEIIQRFSERFKEENSIHSIICRELLGLDGASKPAPAPRTDEYYRKRPCSELSGLSAAILEEFM